MSADKQTRFKKPQKPRSDFQRLSRHFMSSLLRSLFLINKPVRRRQPAGFVLPTTALLLLIVTLTVGTLSYRTFSRTSSVIAQRDQQVVDSAAAPTIDRAKAKLEYLFSKDERFPGGVPASDVINSMLLNDGNNGIPINASNPYTFPGETRIDINGDNVVDNAWVFTADVNGDGRTDDDELVVYSMLMDDEGTDPRSGNVASVTDSLSQEKANALVVRNGPINTTATSDGCGSSRAPEAGWQVVNSSTLQKNFQITAFVANRENAVNGTASALDFQQVRQANRGNKWGAWFKYDLELFPGAARDFFWNGAMHTEGNLIVRDKYVARMISSHNSCLYTRDASEITLATNTNYDGEVLSAKIKDNNFVAEGTSQQSPKFHLFTTDSQPPETGDDGKLEPDTDSVTADREDLRSILLDPIKLFTEDKLAHRSDSGWLHDTSAWDSGNFVNAGRIYNAPSTTPYLDDTYRADNRYGPKPVYDDRNRLPDSTSIGAPIVGNTALTALDATANIYGLDGYWERRAIGQGLRVIVGKRLELGDSSGWKRSQKPTEWPMYPPNTQTSSIVRQRRSLHDNLAAVQGMVVYHHESNSGTLPAACIASTAHPGSKSSIVQSRTFNTVSINGTTRLNTDFFNGIGTNGWEFAFPYTTNTAFSNAIADSQPLGKVLRNLGNFAGDPLGGAPSFVPAQDNNVHPAPYMAAWGDFSQLRRILASGTAYANLSPADQSVLHSAACTIGMLAYNLNNEIQRSEVDYGSVQALGNHIEKMIDGGGSGANVDIDTFFGVNGSDGQPVIQSSAKGRHGYGAGDWDDTVNNSITGAHPRAGCIVDVLGTGAAAYDRACDAADYYGQFTTTDFYRALDEKPGLGNALKAKFLVAQAILERGSQFERDRLSGFRPGGLATFGSAGVVSWNSDTGVASSASPQLVTGCDPDLFPASQAKDKVALALALCQGVSKDVKYPSLYYLFPHFDHDHDGRDDSGTNNIYLDHTQPPTEEYIADSYVTSQNSNIAEDNFYTAVSDADILALASAFTPRLTDFSDWVLPTTSSASELTEPDTQPFTINFGSTGHDITLLDKGMYDGRELMGLRMLDLDINKLTANTNVSDRWISDTDGIVYAFREDAIREDSIVRPKDSSTTWEMCDTWNEVYTDNSSSPYAVVTNNDDCRLKTVNLTGPPLRFFQDPPLMTTTNISAKPVDFYADPDRRPYGFRLLNGSTLNRPTSVLSGMTFVSDNTVYIKGDFNIHTSTTFNPSAANACTDFIEEFDEKMLKNDCDLSNILFYGDRTNSNDNFANPSAINPIDSDRWRPVEIVGDAVGVLSGSFRDGNVDDMFTLARTESSNFGSGTSSYQNQNRLKGSGSRTPGGFTVDRNGSVINLLFNSGSGVTPTEINETSFIQFADEYAVDTNEFRDFQKKRTGDLQPASETVANAVFISGIVPSQVGQSYGGMHNFPRFLESWKDRTLNISGGFFQLNFSTSATGPYDPDAWEPGDNPTIGGGDIALYYGAPDRIWGYDVGLQYAPAGPIARRFVSVGRPRSEFYRELPVDDPYVNNLRCATFNGSTIDSTATCP